MDFESSPEIIRFQISLGSELSPFGCPEKIPFVSTYNPYAISKSALDDRRYLVNLSQKLARKKANNIAKELTHQEQNDFTVALTTSFELDGPLFQWGPTCISRC